MDTNRLAIYLGLFVVLAVLFYAFVVRRLHPRNQSRVLLAAFLAISLGAGYYFTVPQPLTGKVNMGLDLQGGIHVVLEAVDTPEAPVDEISMQKAVDIIRDRVDRLGVAEPIIQRASDKRIVVEIPGVKDATSALEVIGRTALLEFVDEDGNLVFTGRDLQRADVSTRGEEPVVLLELKPEGAKKFAEATEKNVGRRILILLDKEIISAPLVQEAIPTGRAVIQGYDTVQSAYQIAVMLSSGALPVRLDVIENRTVSATLGQDSIARSKTAGLIALAAVAVFMIIFYRLPGVLATYALAAYIFILMAVLISIKATLTLPGIAGIVLSIGMAVDANCIIFERIREEMLSGRTIRSAIDAGFANAMRTVMDSNITTLIAAGVLFYLGTGPIRGFAVTLSLGIFSSLFTAVVVTRWVMKRMIDSGLVSAKSSAFLS